MVDLDSLAALDGLQWLRTVTEVASRFNISPPTVSRHTKKCLNLFGLRLERINGEWITLGDRSILHMERHVHQTARWLGYRPLRLEATYWSGPLLCTPAPQGWMLGLCNIVGIQRNFQLVRERIVDACITGLPDLPASNDKELTSIQLSSMPVFFVANPEHPIRQTHQLAYSDIAMYPTLGLPEGAYPAVQRSLQSIGLWNDVVRMSRYRQSLWEGKSEAELTIGYGTALSMEISGANLIRLPLHCPFVSGEALVVRREWLDHPRLVDLRHTILQRLVPWTQKHPEINLCNGPNS